MLLTNIDKLSAASDALAAKLKLVERRVSGSSFSKSLVMLMSGESARVFIIFYFYGTSVP